MKFVLYVNTAAFTLLTTLCAWFWYSRYYIWKGCFNEKGRCYDAATNSVYLEQAGILWGSASIFFLCLTLFLLYRFFKR